ncbi:MAG: tRNA (adenosine(37)-N6)-threonylcarbamoyltransferase complex ATPase subunit type 1 TsaE [bacterium]
MNILSHELIVESRSVGDTHKLARHLLKQLPGRVVMALHGDLGSGKTCFVQGLAAALGIKRPVTSPTFTLIHEYKGSRPLVHVDLYRLRDSLDALMLGMEEYFDSEGITAVEWADRAVDLFPEEAIHLYFEILPDSHARRITIRSTVPLKP